MGVQEEIGHLSDVPLEVRCSLECCPMTVGELLALDKGGIVKTERAAGDNVDVQISGELIGHGEIIVAGKRIAVRLTEFKEKT
ncbi:MAG: FliM/FliN family flagellar motor switch protein [Bryobacteraceae bacterium]